MLPPESTEVARLFRVTAARGAVRRVWDAARWMDTRAVRQAAEHVCEELHSRGITDVRIEDIPADGKTSVGGWFMPVAWDVDGAQLDLLGNHPRVLADFARIPQSVALLSPPTPAGGWVEGGAEVLEVRDGSDAECELRKAQTDLAGHFVVVPAGAFSQAANVLAAERGALAVVLIHPGPLRTAAKYENYAVPLDAGRACVPVFCLTADAGRALLGEMRRGDVRLRARVQARRYAGSAPMVTGSVGAGGPPIYLCAHLDEIGAQDNASGCGVAIEVLGALRRAAQSGRFPEQRRQIRFFFSTEVRGQQWWFTHREPRTRFLAGLNLDMVGGDASRPEEAMQVLTGFRHLPHFAGALLVEAADLADRVIGPISRCTRSNYTSDAVPGLCGSGGHTSLEQHPGRMYHSSADTPAALRSRTLHWSGAAATAFLYTLTRLGNAQILRTARRRLVTLRRRPGDASIAAELASCRSAMSTPDVYPEFYSAAQFHQAGVNRRTGCWPATRELEALERMLRCVPEPPHPPVSPASLVPRALFRGFLSFEDHIDDADIAELSSHTGLRPGWGTESWAWTLVSRFRGKQALEQIHRDLADRGMPIDWQRAVDLTLYLVDRSLVRLRPVLTACELRNQLRAVGVKRGAVLMAHVSLSQFGYVLGGPATIVSALLDVLGPEGTLIMPTHSNSVLGSPPYDSQSSPSRTGAVTEYFRRLPGVLRSPHPTHSVAAMGPAARELVSAHRVDQAPLARDGFWGRLYDMDGDILLMCPIRSATVFHVGETWLGLPQRSVFAHALDADGHRRVYCLANAPWHVDHFEDAMARPLIESGAMASSPLGESQLYLCSARAMSDISVQRLSDDSTLCLGKGGACDCSFCRAVKRGLGSKP